MINETNLWLNRLKESRRMFLQAIEGLNLNQLTQSKVEGEWTISDLMAHIESWDRACLLPLQTYAKTNAFHPEPIANDLAFNEQHYQEWKGKPFEAIQTAFHQTRAELIQLLEQLPSALLEAQVKFPWNEQGAVKQLADGLASHEQEHLKSILHWLDHRDNS